MAGRSAPYPGAVPSNSGGEPATSLPRSVAGWSRVVAILVAVLVVVGAGVLLGDARGWFRAGPARIEGGAASTTQPTDSAGSARDGVDEVLQSRATALAERDRQAWLATVDPDLPQVVEAQARLFDNMGPVPFDRVEFRYVEAGGQLSAAQQAALGPEAWVAKVVFAYRLSGVADTEIRREQYLTMARRQGSWYVAGTNDGPTEGVQRDPWELGPVVVERGARSFVIATSPDALAGWAAKVDVAAANVDKVWGTAWPRTVVVVVPSTQTEMAQLLGRTDETGLARIAAVTTGEMHLPAGQTADRVIVNPAGFDQLEALGRDVVLTHEVTHVATRSSGPGSIPIWYSEGFADYVAYTTVGVPTRQAVGEYLAAVREERIEPALPTQEDFDASAATELTMAYSSAYLAVEYIDQTYGPEAVTRLYRVQAGAAGADGKASTPMPMAQAMPALLGVDEAAFTAAWRAWVKQVAAGQQPGAPDAGAGQSDGGTSWVGH